MKNLQPPDLQALLTVGPNGVAVVTVSVPFQLTSFPVLQPPRIPVAWTVTVWSPRETGLKSTTPVLWPGASGGDWKIDPSTPRSTWMLEQLTGEEVNATWATSLVVIVVVNAGVQTWSGTGSHVMWTG